MFGALKNNIAAIKHSAMSKALSFFIQNTPNRALNIPIIYEAFFSVKAIVPSGKCFQRFVL